MNAVTNQVLDHASAKDLARRIRAQHRRCWRNAALGVSHLDSDAQYVEGWIVTSGRRPHVIEHGWCESGGRVIDPTYVPQVTPDQPPTGYFGGFRFSVAEAERALSHRLPIAWSNETPEYWNSFEAAWRFATTKANLAPAEPARVVHCRQDSFDEFIGRPTEWASPFHFGADGNRHQVVARYLKFLVRHPGLLRTVWNLRGKALGCRCAPLPCHGDVLARLANVTNIPEGELFAPWMDLITIVPPEEQPPPPPRPQQIPLTNLPARARAQMALRR